jgi:hypothetical protein
MDRVGRIVGYILAVIVALILSVFWLSPPSHHGCARNSGRYGCP